jgi:hypothetical protein
MPIEFTKHALKQMRAIKIDKNSVIKTLKNPDKELTDKFGNKVAQKRFGRVFYVEKNEIKRIITTYQS